MPQDKAIGLLSRASSGTWKSGTLSDGSSTVHDLPFGGAADDSRGFVRRDVVSLENGAERHALRTHPKWSSQGYIKGWLPVADAPENPVFEADVGFKAGAQATDGVTFRVYAHYEHDGNIHWDQVAATTKAYTGRLSRLRADLGEYGTSLRKVELRVDAGDQSTQDWAVWVDPVVYSDGDSSNTVSGFLPSTGGLFFENDFRSDVIPDRTIQVPDPFGGGTISTPDIPVDYGLCGGMAFAVRDYYDAGISPWDDDLVEQAPDDSPTSTDQPDENSQLFRYLWERLIDSFNLGNSPSAVGRFAKLMHPSFRDKQHPVFNGDANRASVIRQEWNTITSKIDDDTLCPLGVVEHKTWNTGKIFYNHQVLAYGYEKEGSDATIYVYDPNAPRNDHVRIEFPLRDPEQVIRAQYRRSFLEQVDGTLDGMSVSSGSADSTTGTDADGEVWQGNDGFRFAGNLRDTSLEKPGQVTVHLDGEEVDWFGNGTRTLVIDGDADEAVEYEFTVSGDDLRLIDGTVDGHSVTADAADSVSGTSASGTVWSGKDGYEFSGEIVSASIDAPEDVTVYVDGEEVDQFTGTGEGTGTRSLVLEGNASNGSDYSFSVSGEAHPDDTIYAFFAIDYSPKSPPQHW